MKYKNTQVPAICSKWVKFILEKDATDDMCDSCLNREKKLPVNIDDSHLFQLHCMISNHIS